jgi:hypothetical protein
MSMGLHLMGLMSQSTIPFSVKRKGERQMNPRRMVFVVIALWGTVLTGNAQNGQHDGDWWRSQNQLAKYHYAAGLLDGMTVGFNFLEFGMSAEIRFKTGVPSSSKTASQKSVHISGGQLIDGLDRFYSDNRNGRVAISNAVTVILDGVAGMPQTALKKMIEQYREVGC